jgi:hypothetical protein
MKNALRFHLKTRTNRPICRDTLWLCVVLWSAARLWRALRSVHTGILYGCVVLWHSCGVLSAQYMQGYFMTALCCGLQQLWRALRSVHLPALVSDASVYPDKEFTGSVVHHSRAPPLPYDRQHLFASVYRGIRFILIAASSRGYNTL